MRAPMVPKPINPTCMRHSLAAQFSLHLSPPVGRGEESYAQFSRARIALPITQSLSSSDRNGNSSVNWVMRWR